MAGMTWGGKEKRKDTLTGYILKSWDWVGYATVMEFIHYETTQEPRGILCTTLIRKFGKRSL